MVALGTGVAYATLSANATRMTFRPVRPAAHVPDAPAGVRHGSAIM